ncbi:MAG TPA: helix-turn-helix transcriptional regulator [Pyrinomonadaceae bacterium]|jgi:transcriptional regulator with XRE-family HTH domain
MQQETLSQYVARLMSEKQLSGYDIQRRSCDGISQSYTNRIKNGDITNPTPEKLKALAKGLGVPEEELFRVARGAESPPTDFEAQLLATAAEAADWTAEEKRFFIAVVRTVAAGMRHGSVHAFGGALDATRESSVVFLEAEKVFTDSEMQKIIDEHKRHQKKDKQKSA